MDVYLVRHAIAYERSRKRWPNDALRPLTPAGKHKFRKAARGLTHLLPKSALMLTSPFVRARDTALILAEVSGLRAPVQAAELSAGRPARDALALLRAHRKRAVVFVGHEPNLSNFLSLALGGENASLKITFKKGGAACLEFGSIRAGAATLRWLIPPGASKAIKRRKA